MPGVVKVVACLYSPAVRLIIVLTQPVWIAHRFE